MVSKQSNCAKSLLSSQSSPTLLKETQNSLSRLSLYLGLKVVHPYWVFIIPKPFQTCIYVRSNRLK